LRSVTPTVSFFPNPITDVLNIMLPSASKQVAKIVISDASGKMVINKSMSLEKGYNNLQINEVSALPSGMFLVTIVMAESTITQKIIK
jgi:predicted ester cyclase